MKRRRMQIDLRSGDEHTLARARHAFGTEGDSETGRALLELFSKLAAAVEQGAVISFLPGDDARTVDALPEFSRALKPERRYLWLVAVPHPWRRQLSIKGRRLTAGQLVTWMEWNKYSVEQAATAFDLNSDAVAEAVDYASRYRDLIDAEAAEERRRGLAAPTVEHRASTPG